MPRLEYNEDIFQESTMTFGEHLEELRVRLFRAILGLVAGVIVGFCIGGYVVEAIKAPLENALVEHYTKVAEEDFKKAVAAAEEEGRLPPDQPKSVKDFLEKYLPEELRKEETVKKSVAAFLVKYLPEEMYVSTTELVARLKEQFPAQFKNLQLPGNPDPKGGESGLIPLTFFRRSASDPRVQAKTFSVQEPFMIWLKASLLVGVILSAPWIFYQIWQFVAAGLYPHEKKYVHIYLPFSIGLFLLGVCVAYFGVFRPVLGFLFSFNRSLGFGPDPRITEWLGFFLLLPLGFGIAFQLPLVMLFLERVGIFTVKGYLSYWRVAILVIFVIAALLTPPDPFSMSFLAGPLSLLYFGGILLCRMMPGYRPSRDTADN
jgi:sec-independent protein translocase protein TatC